MTTDKSRNSIAVAVLVLATVFASYSYSYHGKAYDNALSRLDLAFSIALSGKLDIDRYQGNTIDKAFYDGHYYCDKAPGTSLAAVPVIVIMKYLLPGADLSPDNARTRFIVTLFVIGLPSLLAAFILLLLTRGITGMDSALPALFYSIGSLALPYSIMFYSHQFCAALLLFAFYIYFNIRTERSTPTAVNGLAIGLLLGYSIISEYTAAIPAAIIAVAVLINSRNKKHWLGIIAGGLAPIVILAMYNNAVFGHPLRIGYTYEVNEWFRNEMGRGIGGIGFPKPGVLLSLLFSPQRGLVWGQPFILLSVPGLYYLWKNKGPGRAIAVISSAVILSAVIMNAGYYEPYGGFAPGPRFLVWSLPFWFIAAATGYAASGVIGRAFAAGAGVFSVFYYMLITAVEPHVPHVFSSPLLDFTIPLLRAGWEFTNRGVFMNLDGVISLAPLAALVLICVAVVVYRDFSTDNIIDSAGGIAGGFLGISLLFMLTCFQFRPDPVRSAYYTGTALNGNGRYEQAEEYLDYSVSMRPDFAAAQFALGIAQIKNNKYNDAINSFMTYVKLNPGDRQGHVSVVAALAAEGRLPEAKEYVDRSLSLFPGDNILTGLSSMIEARTGSENSDEQ